MFVWAMGEGLAAANPVAHTNRREEKPRERVLTDTGMADIGIQPHIIEAVLNHVSGHKGGIAGIYNRATYSKEKAEALARWDAHIAAVVKEVPSKVAGLRGRR
jgi:hypothetical protein